MEEKVFLKKIIQYIIAAEQENDNEHGWGRSIQELIKNNEMPDIYQAAIERYKRQIRR